MRLIEVRTGIGEKKMAQWVASKRSRLSLDSSAGDASVRAEECLDMVLELQCRTVPLTSNQADITKLHYRGIVQRNLAHMRKNPLLRVMMAHN